MRVLVTGGTGVVGTSTVTALLQRGHSVRLLSRHAERDARQWARGVTPVEGDVASAASVTGSADGCDAIIHLAGIAEEVPPDATFERINVGGTRHLAREAERAGVGRFVYVSSLGAERGDSAYHASKRAAEDIVRGFGGEWVIVRPGAVYGPGDEHVSVLLKMVRALPVVPLIGDGNQSFQPAWHEDIAEALALAVERLDLAGRSLDVAGREVTSQRDLVRRFEQITARSPVLVPVPEFLAQAGLKAAEVAGVDVGFDENQMKMLLEGNVIPADAENALTRVFGVEPTPLDVGLRRLADAQPEQLPAHGIGSLKRKRYWADIRGSRFDPDRLLAHVRSQFAELAPSIMDPSAEPGTGARIVEGETLTLSLPLRGHVQVRVVEVEDRRFTMLTLEGHPLAGAVRFQTDDQGGAVRFEIQVYERAATVVDLLMMRTLGELLQNGSWIRMVENVVRASGGQADEVRHTSETLSASEADVVQRWAEELVMQRKQDEAGV